MLMTLRAVLIPAMVCLIAGLPTRSPAASPAQADLREREIRASREREERERGVREARREFERQRAFHDVNREAQERRVRQEMEAELDRLHAELQELHVREVDLRAVMQTRELEGQPGEVHELRRELVHVRHEIERNELEVQRLMLERDRQAERYDLMRMADRLEYVSNWREVAFDPAEAVMMATQAIVELHLTAGDPERAAEVLEQLLNRVDELGSRTAVRFALKDVYAEMDRPEQAAEHMIQVIQENARAIAAMRHQPVFEEVPPHEHREHAP